MNEKQKLQIQVDKVIELLKIRIEDDPTRPILNTLIERYIKAQEILKNEGDIKKIVIIYLFNFFPPFPLLSFQYLNHQNILHHHYF